MIDALSRDFTYAARSLRRTPAFTVTAILILGLAIGMASAMFTVFQNIVLRRLPVQDQDRIVTLTGVGKGAATREFPLLSKQYRQLRNQRQAVSDLAGYGHWGAYAFAIQDGDRVLDLKVAAVTANFFDVLGVNPVLGRRFTQDEERNWGVDSSSGDLRMIISYDTWRRVFHGDTAILGHRLLMPVTKWKPMIVGVAPPGLDFPHGVDYWMASVYEGLDIVARLAPGKSAEAARMEYFNFVDNDPDLTRLLGPHTIGAQVHPFAETVLGDVRAPLLALTVAVGLLLLLACANIGNLQLLRAAERAHDLAIRRSLGAGSWAVLRGLVTESGILAVAGGTLGLVLSRILLSSLLRLAPEGLPRMDVVRQAGAPLAVSSAVTIVAVLLFGLLPAAIMLRTDPSSPLRADARGGTGGRNLRRLRRTLVSAQIALALVVLAGAGLLMRSFSRLVNLDPGYTTARLSIIQVSPPYDRFIHACGGPLPRSDSVGTARVSRCLDLHVFDLHDRVEERLHALPDIEAAATAQIVPFVGPNVFMTKVVGDDQNENQGTANPWVAFESVGPDYFRTLEVPVRGRTFTAADREGAPPVAVISEGVGRALWPGKDPLGRRFHEPSVTSPDSLVTVIGVIPDLHYREYRVSTPTIYRPYRQMAPQGAFAIRTRGALGAALPGIQRAMREMDPDVVVLKAESMDELAAPQLAQPRLNGLLLTVFALAALVLAAVGLYGLMASIVTGQKRELGVRMALGATADSLRWMILSQAFLLAGAGALAGLIGVFLGSRLVASMLFDVTPNDPVTLVAVSLVLLSVAGLAAYLPARRATKVDAAVALRAE